MIAASENNLKYLKNALGFSTIGYDKLNQLRHLRFFGGKFENLVAHMKKHKALIAPSSGSLKTHWSGNWQTGHRQLVEPPGRLLHLLQPEGLRKAHCPAVQGGRRSPHRCRRILPLRCRSGG